MISLNSLISIREICIHAPLTARPSKTSRISYISIASSIQIPLTIVPFLGIFTAKPSLSNCLSASLTGVLLTPIAVAILFSINLSPGFISPVNIAVRSSLRTISLIDFSFPSSKFFKILLINIYILNKIICDYTTHTLF